jgi:hypothetical protein
MAVVDERLPGAFFPPSSHDVQAARGAVGGRPSAVRDRRHRGARGVREQADAGLGVAPGEGCGVAAGGGAFEEARLVGERAGGAWRFGAICGVGGERVGAVHSRLGHACRAEKKGR